MHIDIIILVCWYQIHVQISFQKLIYVYKNALWVHNIESKVGTSMREMNFHKSR